MTDAPRRPILSLKFPPAPKAPPPAAAKETRWKCKPCGAAVVLTGAEPEDQEVRCPACNAKLGLVAQFLSDPPSPKIRARR
jgi:DNA-directed RNA polymerase subunit RPC12/RpoP